MFFIGDTHGNHQIYMALIEQMNCSLHVGDVGLGFLGHDDKDFMPSKDHKFIRGNHDNPATCQKYPNYIGEWGEKDGLFFISGADSIDKRDRQEGINWWKDEQLSYSELGRVMGEFVKTKPKIVVTHCCPSSVVLDMQGENFRADWRSMTEEAMDQMFDAHRPDLWIFGHYHRRWRKSIKGCQFICLDMFRSGKPIDRNIQDMTFEIKDLTWS